MPNIRALAVWLCQGAKRRGWAACAWLMLCAFTWCVVMGTSLPAHSAEVDAEGVITLTEGQVVIDQQALSPPPDFAPWAKRSLPHDWTVTNPSFQGAMWYRFAIDLKAAPTKPWAIYIPRAATNAHAWVNGNPLAYNGVMTGEVTSNWYVPLMSTIQPSLLKTGRNIIHVQVISTDYGARGGISAVYIGPIKPLATANTWRSWAQLDGSQTANIGLMTLGIIMLIVWAQDREQTSIGFSGLASMTWGASVLAIVTPNPWWDDKSGTYISFVLSVDADLLLALFCFRFTGPKVAWRDYSIYALIVGLPCYGLLAQTFSSTAWTYALCYLIAVSAWLLAMWRVIRARRQGGWWLVAGILPVLPAGAHDVLLMLGSLPFDAIYWLFYAVPFMMACVMVIVAGDYARSRMALNDLNRTLADRISERERALRESFERLAALEQAQAVSAERSRILQDMHDGVGTHLTSALRQLQGHAAVKVDVPLVAQTLRDSLDQLKLSIDALSLVPGDVAGLLGSWRFRLAPRLKAAGIELVWDVDALPDWPAGQSSCLRNLQYILFEGLSNVLQHAGATRLVLSAREFGDNIRISLIDNGAGWCRAQVQEGQGLQTMRSRAKAINAVMEFVPAANGGLELRLSLPMPTSQQADATDLSSAA